MKRCLKLQIWIPVLLVSLTAGAADDPNNTTQTNPDEAAVTVNNEVITEGQVAEIVNPQIERMAERGKNLPDQFLDQYKKQLRQRAMDRLIVEKLLAQKVKEKNIVVSDEQVMTKLRELASQRQPSMTMDEFKKLVETYGKSFDEVKQQVRKGLAYEKLMEQQWADKTSVTDQEAKEYYDQHSEKFHTPEQVKASHILIKTDTSDPNTDPNQVDAQARTKAENLLKQLKQGADFATLAKENSDCPSSRKGGDLGYFSKKQMVKPFAEAAFALKEGQISDLVKTRYGYHIIKQTGHKDASTTPFEGAKADILETLKQQKQSQLAREYINLLKEKADITYPPGKEQSEPAALPIPAKPQEK